MKKISEVSSIKCHVKIAGFAYLLITFLGLLNSFIIKPGTNDVKNFMETALQYRLAQGVDMLMFVTVMCLSWTLYLVTRPVNKNIALLALLFRFGEGLLGCIIVLLGLAVLVVLQGNGSWIPFNEEQLQALALMLMKFGKAMWSILFILMGIGAAIFMYLFYVSRYIPGLLAGWGVFTYASMLALGCAEILVPGLPRQAALIMLPGALFEFIFGIWLLVKGINVSSPELDI
jgi:hypothetical protein